MNIFVLDYFIAVAEYHNFTKAADALYITQPTLSRQIDMLEKEIGIKLFIRNSHAVSLTPAGEVFLEEARDVIRRYQKMKLRMESVKRGINQTLNVGYSRTISFDALAKALRVIYKEHPKIEVSLIQNESGDLYKNLLNKNLDIIFTLRLELENNPGLMWNKVENGELRCLINDEHPFSNLVRMSIEKLADERLIFPPRGYCPIWNDYLLKLFEDKKLTPNILTIQEHQNVKFLVKSGFGSTLLSFCSDDEPTKGTKSIPVVESSDLLDIIVIWKEDNLNPAIQILLNEIENQKLL